MSFGYNVVTSNDLLIDPLNYYLEYVYNVPVYFSLQYMDVINTYLLVILMRLRILMSCTLIMMRFMVKSYKF